MLYILSIARPLYLQTKTCFSGKFYTFQHHKSVKSKLPKRPKNFIKNFNFFRITSNFWRNVKHNTPNLSISYSLFHLIGNELYHIFELNLSNTLALYRHVGSIELYHISKFHKIILTFTHYLNNNIIFSI